MESILKSTKYKISFPKHRLTVNIEIEQQSDELLFARMRSQPNIQRICSLLTFALIRNTTSSYFAFASAFSPSSCLSSASSASFTARNMAERNVASLTFLETSNSNGESTLPATLLVHGLDSSSHTWRGLLEDLGSSGFGALAVDNRGCGKSPLGDPTLFSPDALVDDLYALVTSHPLFTSPSGVTKPFVFVGHSMGGRIGMSFAAKYPELIAALVIEDMDIVTRGMSMSYVQSNDRTATVAFDRELSGVSTSEEVIAAFGKEGYPPSVVQKWLSEGRVEQTKDTFYSQVNPAFRLLCYETIFDTSHGEDTWKKLAAVEQDKNFPIHLMVSDPTMTVCFEDSISLMKNLIEESSSPARLTIHRYPGATHSIHNSAAEKFTADLKDIIEKS